MADFRAMLAAGRTDRSDPSDLSGASALSCRPLVFDGAMGTLLQARGLPAGEPPERFCLARPDVLKGIHADYLAAGADIILTATFGGTRFKLPPLTRADGSVLDATAFNREMARIARAAADEAAARFGRPCFVGGDMGPCGRFVRPLGDLPPLELYAAYRCLLYTSDAADER